MSMMHHNTGRGIAAPQLLRAAISDADANQLIGPALRRATSIDDAQAVHDAIEIGELAATIGMSTADFDRFAKAFTAPDPASVIADWVEHETRPRMRRALTAALTVIDEEAGR